MVLHGSPQAKMCLEGVEKGPYKSCHHSLPDTPGIQGGGAEGGRTVCVCVWGGGGLGPHLMGYRILRGGCWPGHLTPQRPDFLPFA